MKLLEIIQGGFLTPLNAVQIAGLFDSGCPGQHCDTARQSVRRPRGSRRPFSLSLPAALALVPLGAVTTAVVGYLFFGARPSIASPIATSAVSQSALPTSGLTRQTNKNSTAQRRSSPAGTSAPAAIISPAGASRPLSSDFGAVEVCSVP